MNKSYTKSRLRKEKFRPHLPLAIESSLDPAIARYYRHFPHHRFYYDDEELFYHGMDSDDDQPPLTKQLESLLYSVHPRHKYYVYDVYYYDIEKKKNPHLAKMTENTLRIGVMSPMIFGTAQQNEDILDWAIVKDLVPEKWNRPDVVLEDVSDSMRTNIEIVDAFVQCLLRSDAANLVKISYHIGEWYNFTKRRASHTMNKKYDLKELKKDLQKMMLLQSIWLIYTDVPKELIWYLAVFVCHQYFFYLADSEYKRHNLLTQLEDSRDQKDAMKLKDEGNAHYKAEEYSEAIKKYGQALKMSPYNHQLYANRAISYLKLKEVKYASRPSMANKCAISAMSDAFRCIKLDPLYAKGHDRYAMALKELGHQGEAVKALEAAMKTMKQSAPEGELRVLENRLVQYSGESKPRKKRADGDAGGISGNGAATQNASNSLPPQAAPRPSIAKSQNTTEKAKDAASSAKDNAKEESFKAIKEDLQRTMKNGSEALLGKKYRFAINLYDRCFKLTQESSPQNLGQSIEKMHVLRYARCVAYINVGPNEDIVMGINELTQLLDHQPSQTMKAIALYELGNAYVKKHRYTCAMEPVTQALQLCNRKKGLRDVYCWPGTQTFIEHTDKTVLKEKLAALIAECRNPPQPDFMCLSDLCTSYGYANSSIYINDPDFRGYVCISCTEKCFLRYHRDCWRKKHQKVNTPCITPDCGGLIIRCTEYDEQAQKCYEDKADIKPSKSSQGESKVLKLKPSSVKRIAEIARKKQEKKEKRAERKQQGIITGEAEGNLADAILANAEKKETDAPATVNLTSANFVVKQKKQEEVSQQAPRKVVKNKVKTRQVMSLDEFCTPAYDEIESTMSSGSIPLPAQLKDEVAQFERDYHMEQLPVVIQGVSVDKLKESVLDFYYELLESEGPMTADSPELLDFLKGEQAANELVQHCHGLSRFLLSSGRFSQVENIIFIRREEHEKKAHQMVDAVRNTSHGVTVVSNDFKENMARAADYQPERKKYSGYDTVPSHHSPHTQDPQQWRAFIQDWRADNSSPQTRECSDSIASIGMSDEDSELVDQPMAAVVELPSPALLEAWKNSQEQQLMASANNIPGPVTSHSSHEVEDTAPTSNADSVLPSFNDDKDEGHMSHPLTNSSQLLGAAASNVMDGYMPSMGYDEQEDIQAEFDMQTGDIESFGYSPFGDSTRSSFTNSRTEHFPNFSASNPFPPYSVSAGMTGHQMAGSGYTDTPPFMTQGQPFAYPQSNAVAPIGTPARSTNTSTFGAITGVGSSSAAPRYGVSNPSTLTNGNQNMDSTFEKITPSTSDKQCNTEYEYMDDYDKKVEECLRLHERVEHLEDKYTQLKQHSSVQLHDLQGKLEEAHDAEKAVREAADKQQQQADKDMKKLKEEKKSLTEELNSLRHLHNERQRRADGAENKIKELESHVNSLRVSYKDEIEKNEAQVIQYQSKVEMLETQLIDMQLEVINERERHALSNLEELLANTLKSMAEQREQVARLVGNSNGEIPPIVRRNAELTNQRRERLLAIKHEQQSLYESQRDVVRSGTIPLAKIPKLSPPSLMEIMASTAMPRPPLIPMMRPHVRPNVNPQMVPRMRPPMPQGRMPMVGGPPVAPPPVPGPHGDEQGSSAARADAVSKGQSRRNVENQLIQDINNMFPTLTGDDIRTYINRLRESRQGLTGLKVMELKRQIVELVLQDNSLTLNGQGISRANSVGDECSICHEKISNGSSLRTLDCGHEFHNQCIAGWEQRENSCPICRRQIS